MTAQGGGYSAAGIGGGFQGNGSNITISGGNVKATGAESGAGIGGGFCGDGSNIRISGGNVKATGAESGAGIGGGYYASGSDIEISGGTVEATGGDYGAGIGGGYCGIGNNITISGGKVNATGKKYGAGIGGGSSRSGSNIRISGGEVTATGNLGAGIGAGDTSIGSNIKISGGTVNATSEHGPGIDGGQYNHESDIVISGGKVTASSEYGAGIGAGEKEDYWKNDGNNITISGGNVTATGGENGSGIGGGYDENSERIYINGGSVNASSENGQMECQPVVSAQDATPVYLTRLIFNNGALVSNTAVDSVTSTYNTYGLEDVATDGNGIVYAYLPENTITTAATLNGIADEFRPESDIVTTKDDRASGTLYSPLDITVIQPSEGGTVSVDAEGSKARPGAPVMLSNTPNTGYEFGRYIVTDAAGNSVPVDGDMFTMPASNVTVTAVFGFALDLSAGTIQLNVGQNGLTYTQGEVVDRPYEGAIAITQSNPQQQTPNGIYIHDVSPSGTSVADPTAYITLKGINTGGEFMIDNNCKRNVVITLANGTDNVLSAGLTKPGDETSGTLTIQAEDGATEETWGRLTATGTGDAAGIGGSAQSDGSNITITGGNITAVGNGFASGIGGGNHGRGSKITIAGGKVDAIGSDYAAGIGGGYDKDGSNIKITGGNVTAAGGYSGAGIGGGNCLIGSGDGNNITITGGNVTATGGYNGAGIGGGSQGFGCNITITGGMVTATGGYCGAGIGGGGYGVAINIAITGGTVVAVGRNYGSGIGGGRKARSEEIYISGGSVKATCENENDEAIGCQPVVSAEDPTPVYLTKLTFNNGTPVSNTAVSSLDLIYDGESYVYGLNGAATDENGTFYAYLPEDASTTAAVLSGIEDEFQSESAIITTVTKALGTLYTPFAITVNQPSTGGTVSVEGATDKVYPGTSVTLSNMPNDDYLFGAYLVTDAAGNEVDVDGDTFIMPTSNATVTGTFIPIEDGITLNLDEGNITLSADSNYLTYTQGEDIDQPYKGTVTITQTHPDQQLTNTITIEDIPSEGTSVKDPTANVKLNAINTSGEFKIADECARNVVITLADGTDNVLSAGLTKSGDETSGTLTIQAENGATEETWGSLTATAPDIAGDYSAGIGGSDQSAGSNITITGGNVKAVGGDLASGIGGGNMGSGNNIKITGGKVIATGGGYGAGIGGGDHGNGSHIEISGGKIDATGGLLAAGIGGGVCGSANNITISGGNIFAVGGSAEIPYGGAAGIGGGRKGDAHNITISGGEVTATAGHGAAGIGGGSYGIGGIITLSGGTVAAAGKDYANGIGGGQFGSSNRIYISGGSVKATSENGEAIGYQPVVSAEDPTPVYLTKLTFNNGTPVSNTAVSALDLIYDGESYAYGLNGAATDENGTFYAYLPEHTVTTAGTLDGIESEFQPESDIITTTTETSGTLYASTNAW